MNKHEIIELCMGRVSGAQMNFSAQDTDQAIRNAFVEILGTDKIDKKIYRRHAVDIFEIIEDVMDQTIVDSEMRKNAFFDTFVEQKFLQEGDANLFYIPNNSELAVSRVSRGNWTIERQRVDQGKDVSLSLATYGIKVYEEFVRFMTGKIDFPALISKMVLALEKFYSQLAYDTFTTALAGLPAIFKHNGAYDEDKIVNLIQSVETANGEVATIIGTKAGLTKLQATYLATAQLSDRYKDQVVANGYIVDFKGTRCLEIPQGFKAGSLMKGTVGNEVPDFIFDDNTLFVVTGSERPVKMYYSGSEMSKGHTDAQTNEDMTVEEQLIINVGCGISFNKLFAHIVLV